MKDVRTGQVINNRIITVSVNDQTGMKLGAKAYPAGAGGAQGAMTFTGTGSAAKVSPNGTVTFVMKGTVTVKATAADGSKVSASFRITEK